MFGATVIVPSGFSVNPAGTLVGVNVTSVGTNGNPFKVSLARTLGVVPPGVPLFSLRWS